MAGLSSRSAVAIHALAMLAHRRGGSLTSAEIADSLDSNPVLVRRVLGRLRDAQLVRSTDGRGGGWSLARTPRDITLHDAYAAVEGGRVFSRHPHPPSGACVIGRNIGALLDVEFRSAERALEEQLGRTTIAALLQQILACDSEAQDG
ncbi:Rrf2 family transcriptional regulator [Streptomyces sp. WAC04189]|uniref:Rrf2 family transcriptional regulator n=1 Tax=Streptomyces TaxID=1883 RepID=UPI0007832968|nr:MULTISPECIES: Rrf2 family transcriptional regulator [Streptomyces]GGY60101.1 Rrf2 family transcriptional regulator [Streptomyces geysiriensis]KYK14051.1 Rrf2 family transcriptional regulator [Streptomyces sp. CC71]RSR98500.1 Rrf2 family transcriptional regulator [Streptomyces sp. WAC04189]RSS65947.1 Rrf2 family transcriptional regulator [Streptomyces sp. WAC06273]RSS73798.1 Rrf2 family transcriptional regulator [Streptomyces sp. WAC06128]